MQIFANPMSASPFAAAQPADTGSTTSSDSDSATITANDFLQLLVSEMKNQDPTADTDPNEYVNQLVQVNSLEQLVSINQDLSGLGSASDSEATGRVVGAGQAPTSATPAAGTAFTGAAGSAPTAVANTALGNLSATDTGPAGSRLARGMSAAAQTLAPNGAASPMSSALESLKSRAHHHAYTNVSNPAR
ncbi:MAG TPA: flagellar hook capping FlgD N-terminal domain-containing protein [Acidobacteriaceae bacterium]|jgi:flagellar basal-body rod modification protein FlgD|nr:flagellar hook capping FlgD N-terminal domain-containing protein [Acidobacteriaceae bacterium]